MRLIRRLIDLRANGSPEEQDFVDLFVSSKNETYPLAAADPGWDRAWALAEDDWEKEVERERQIPGRDAKQAEIVAANKLYLVAVHRLKRLGWQPSDSVQTPRGLVQQVGFDQSGNPSGPILEARRPPKTYKVLEVDLSDHRGTQLVLDLHGSSGWELAEVVDRNPSSNRNVDLLILVRSPHPS